MTHLIFFPGMQWTLLFGSPDGSDLFTSFILITLIFIIYGVVKAFNRSINSVDSHWHHMFETQPFASSEFYQTLEKEIEKKEVEGLTFLTVTHLERGILSAKRLYLRVTFREYMMDICAAPFAKEAFFISWWLGDAGVTLRDYLMAIPVFGKLFSRREKTFYEQDTEIMFKELIAQCVKDTIDRLVEEKGVRKPDMLDWRGSDLKFKS